MKKAILLIEDGYYCIGRSRGADGERFGELVFNTSMSGYQEVLTDPSYKGQIVMMTYPHMGNYGIHDEDSEHGKINVEGFIVKELQSAYGEPETRDSLEYFLKDRGVICLEGVDTRSITRHIREKGAMKAIISTVDFDIRSLTEKVFSSPGLVGRDMVKEVSCKSTYQVCSDTGSLRVLVYDFGVKRSIIDQLVKANFSITVVPARTSADEVMSMAPDGIVLSNGPGDPDALHDIVGQVGCLLGQKPILGICLGHQLLGLALGGKTYKMKFGHRGINHPVKELSSGKIFITSQNHGFCLDPGSLKNKAYITHVSLNDGTVEGMYSPKKRFFSIQYHPESSPGPHDSLYLFKEFRRMISA